MTQRFIFEQEVDKRAKALMVDSIQFRNSFDTEGPLIPGLSCEEAMEKLGDYSLYLCVYSVCVYTVVCMCVCVVLCCVCVCSGCVHACVHMQRHGKLGDGCVLVLFVRILWSNIF